MSTKGTIAFGDNFHFYREAGDNDRVYLELEGVQFSAGYNRVMVPIPVHVWEVIRQYQGIDLSAADMTDDEIRDRVGKEVDRRIAKWEESGEGKVSIVSASFVYGGVDAPREEQIQNGMEYFLDRWRHDREIRDAIESLQKR
jgi:hypothetical protein